MFLPKLSAGATRTPSANHAAEGAHPSGLGAACNCTVNYTCFGNPSSVGAVADNCNDCCMMAGQMAANRCMGGCKITGCTCGSGC